MIVVYFITGRVTGLLEGKQLIFHFCSNKEIHKFLFSVLVQEHFRVPPFQHGLKINEWF